jgi:hypothetical protein
MVFAQDPSAKKTPRLRFFGYRPKFDTTTVPVSISVNGYADFYYLFDFDRPSSRNLPYFYSSNRHNQIAVNLAYVSFSAESPRFRARLTPAVGTYMGANYAAEPEAFRYVYEASAGVRLTEALWLDAGVLPSLYGYENAVSFDQPTYGRSMSAENSPYYVSGAALSYQAPNRRASFSLYALNGWQNIAREVRFPAGGTKFVWTDEKWTLNWSTYLGDEQRVRGAATELRFFNDVWVKYAPSDKFYVLSLFDVGTWRRAGRQYSWWTAHVIAWTRLSKRWGAALRGETFDDPNGVAPLEAFDPDARYRQFAASFNFDYRPIPQAMLRWETRLLEGYRPYETGRKTTLRVALSLAASF